MADLYDTVDDDQPQQNYENTDQQPIYEAIPENQQQIYPTLPRKDPGIENPTYVELQEDVKTDSRLTYAVIEPDAVPKFDENADKPDTAVVVHKTTTKVTDIMFEDANKDGIEDGMIFDYPAHVKLNYDALVGEPTYFGRSSVSVGIVSKPVGDCLRTWFDTIHVRSYSLVFSSASDFRSLLFSSLSFLSPRPKISYFAPSLIQGFKIRLPEAKFRWRPTLTIELFTCQSF